MTIGSDGTFDNDTKEEILEAMIADAKEYWGEDFEDRDEAIIRYFYEPIAERFAVSQQDIASVLASAQIDNAVGAGLDLLTALIGVNRKKALTSIGSVVFKHQEDGTVAPRDYTISSGTLVQTESDDPVRFETTETGILSGPSTETDTLTYSTTSGSFSSQTSFTIDATYRNTIDVSADIRTTDATTPVSADLEIADAGDGTVIHTDSTTSGSFVTSGPTTYDVSEITGEVTIEYRLKSGDGATSVELTNSTFEPGGQSSIELPVKAVESGVRGNVGANTLIVMPNPPMGVRAVTNPGATTSGRDKEGDESLRSRAKESLGTGSRASAPALINAAKSLEGVKGVSIFLNDSSTDNTGSGGLPDHSFELVVQDGNSQDIADMLLETKAAGDNSYAGVNGTAQTVTTELPNGQAHDVSYSTPNEVKIYVSMDLLTEDDYAGDDAVRDSIVRYVGGLLSSANDETGDLLVGRDVLYGRIEYAVRDIQGVYDIESLNIGTSIDPTGTSDIAIDYSEIATADATDDSITITTTDVGF